MSSLRLVRHGQASYGAANYDVLSPLGIEQARALGRAWARDERPPDAIYTGPMQRQRDTALHAIAAATDGGLAIAPPVVIAELAEYPAFELMARALPEVARDEPALRGLVDGSSVDPALLDRALWAVIERWTDGRLDTGPIETFAAFVTRVERGLDQIFTRHSGRSQRVVAVSSGGPIGVAAKMALGLAPSATVAMWRMVRNGSVSELVWRTRGDRRELGLMGWNHVDHLGPDQLTFR